MQPRLPKWRNYLTAALVLGLLVFFLWNLLGPKLAAFWGSSDFGWPRATAPAELTQEVAEAFERIEVRQNDREAGPYRREVFGKAWADENHNGCDTRNDVLARDLGQVKFARGNCKVASGVLAEPYTGEIWQFQRGPKTSDLIQIDHVVALGDAWRSGAWRWELPKRQRFANDPLNLLAVSGQANQDKGSAPANLWLPPNQAFHCDYVLRQIAVKSKWGLNATKAEKQSWLQVLKACPGKALPTEAAQLPAE
ncbi:hypothetical protein BK816_08695 [Boudabousia tangfeifanii]|uniref:GmrSD restriction endonucleases C-terminal domain-containing protein n=1 Tax=Boudabousia tangfeifanii TaxID=1912795 RepID=A0A1D9MMC2_9ACTO|nr:HNH endonuclease family protein [Boudabousia tangfeifanii]AOZ73339.1 hypothetical protein BK816_08695 [Boudabousia tangfeifanii]